RSRFDTPSSRSARWSVISARSLRLDPFLPHGGSRAGREAEPLTGRHAMAKAKRRTARRGDRRRAAPATRRKVSAIPAGYHSVTPYLTVSNGTRALEFYTKAFGARTKEQMPGPGGRLIHAE